ncbi:DUF4198 domain-containing protein [Sphingoaurantiacus capsulatus]|uniref:DUF4198 domain-containing protein n=1 Tax=Sphingoaurantiacus capsulatus TaxID=1771310 RepID=A0ABV7X7T0_9SPHN
MKTFRHLTLAALSLAAIATPAAAHRQWLLPSATVLSGNSDWVTVDAAVSNDLFYFEHQPLRLTNLQVIGPNGQPVEAQNKATGRYRSTFDVQLTQPGTYRIASVNAGLSASWKEGTETKRWRGTAEGFAKEVPANATDLNVMQAAGRVETFVTAKAPSTDALKPTGQGMEMVPVTHPNDIVAGEAATFQLLIDGAPAKDIEVEVVPGGIRYRDKLGDVKVKTDAEGKFSVTWPTAGMYWIEASAQDNKTSVPQAKSRRLSYVATLEVMSQ